MTKKIKQNLSTLILALEESIWPTRCAICDKANSLLCKDCFLNLCFIDQNLACPKCGEPYGLIQCCNCAKVKKSPDNKNHNYYEMSKSALLLDKNTGRIITQYKDAGEQRLSRVIAYFTHLIIPNNWLNNCCISYIPSTKEAILRRGFDHGELTAIELSKTLNKPLLRLFEIQNSQDQRNLTRKQRSKNTKNLFSINKNALVKIKNYEKVIIFDDVFTTGATLDSACRSLKSVSDCKINCVTFARTY